LQAILRNLQPLLRNIRKEREGKRGGEREREREREYDMNDMIIIADLSGGTVGK
jgi:hypothetical protein